MAEFDLYVPARGSLHAESLASACIYLRAHSTSFVRTPAFIAIIAELLDILHDSGTSQLEAYVAVRRTARILDAFVAEAERKTRVN